MRSRSQRQLAARPSNADEPLFGQRGEELDREKRIAAGLLVHQPRQRLGPFLFAMKGVGDQPEHIVFGQRTKHDGLNARPALADGVERQHERVSGADLVVAIGAEQQEVFDVGVGEQILEKVKRRRIQPLQIVQKQGERMLRAGEDAEEAPEHAC